MRIKILINLNIKRNNQGENKLKQIEKILFKTNERRMHGKEKNKKKKKKRDKYQYILRGGHCKIFSMK